MKSLNRDAIIAILLLLFCGAMFWATTQIRDPGYGQMGAEVWPRAVLAFLTIASLIYLAQSIYADVETASREGAGGGIIGWLAHYQNAILCYLLFFGFLVTLPIFGMLIGGILFVFLMLSSLGGWSPRLIAIHAMIAICSVGAMWSIFTFGLRVMLPEGEILRIS